MVVIRLSRGGANKKPFYRIVVADCRAPRDGLYLEKLGYSMGPRVIELVCLKEKMAKRENKPLEFLKLIHSSVHLNMLYYRLIN